MIVAIVFGLIFSTILTLGVVPVLYATLYRVSFKGFGELLQNNNRETPG